MSDTRLIDRALRHVGLVRSEVVVRAYVAAGRHPSHNVECCPCALDMLGYVGKFTGRDPGGLPVSGGDEGNTP